MNFSQSDTPEEKEFWVQKLQEASKSRDAIVHVGEKKTDGSFAPKWQNDAESDICPACLVKFTAFRRKVWCGMLWCGVVWCGVVWCGVLCCEVEWRF